MKEYTRKTPQFSLCGLNCCLCPRYRTTGNSRCPGCGGADFYDKHPSCGIISCSLKHDGVAYCFQCDDYPCGRYTGQNLKDSFITYLHVTEDMEAAKNGGLENYLERLSKKNQILDELLEDWDNGRMKSYYCTAVNLLPLKDLEVVMSQLTHMANEQADMNPANDGMKGKIAKEYLDKMAAEKGISLKLRR